MSFHCLITGPGGKTRHEVVDGTEFWLGSGEGDWGVGLPLPGVRGRLVQVRAGPAGVEVRAEPGLPVSVLSSAGEIGSRFEPLLEGELLRLGPHAIEVRWAASEPQLTRLDPAALAATATSDLRGWFESAMALLDRLEGVRDVDELARATLQAVLAATGADRCFLQVDVPGADVPREWFLSRLGQEQPFGVSRSLVARVRQEQGVVLVRAAAQDPLVAGLVSVRREGISSSLAVPLRALGRSVGVLYADCVEPGHSLELDDFQKAALLGRMLAGAIGNKSLVRSVLDSEVPPALRSKSPACRRMVEQARIFAPTDYTILIRGETGSGKDVLSRSLHAMSGRAKGPFVAVNCAAIPAQLMESELFGHVKGSFTGALSDRTGLLVAARRGTLLLDEIGDMTLDLQAKILRAIETKEVTPVGGTTPVAVDVRILAATHRDLEAMVASGAFRADLYYRLRELEIRVPPLRERPEDILWLAEQFLGEAAVELQVGGTPGLAPDAVRLLLEHAWGGNVRELKHAMRTALLKAGGGEVRAEHLDLLLPAHGEAAPAADTAGSWRERLEVQEKAALRATFEQAGGNLTRAAQLFGLPRTTYRERLVKYGLI